VEFRAPQIADPTSETNVSFNVLFGRSSFWSLTGRNALQWEMPVIQADQQRGYG
jgi:hypothetical protein